MKRLILRLSEESLKPKVRFFEIGERKRFLVGLNLNGRSMTGGLSDRRGVALVFTLSVGVLLIVLSISLFSFYSSEVYSQGQQQKAIQAYWNARAGLEHFCLERRVPASGPQRWERPGL